MPDANSNPANPRVLKGDGSYGFTAIVEGDDIVVRGVHATWFGGAHDPQDNGETASGVNTKRNPKYRGCALPMGGYKLTRGSPLPDFPYLTTRVEVTRQGGKQTININLIDLGPSAPPRAHAAIDLTVAAFLELGGSLATGWMIVDFRVLGGAKYLPGISGGKTAAVASRGTAAAALLAVPMLLASLILGSPILADAAPTPAEIGAFFQMLTWIGASVGSVLGCAVAIKTLRRRPVVHPQMPQPLVVTSAKEFALASDLAALEEDVESRHQQNLARFNTIDEKLDRNFKSHSAAQAAEMKSMHERLNRVAESNAQLVGEMKHVVAAAEKASNAAVVAAEAARGAIQASNDLRRSGSPGHFSGGQG